MKADQICAPKMRRGENGESIEGQQRCEGLQRCEGQQRCEEREGDIAIEKNLSVSDPK